MLRAPNRFALSQSQICRELYVAAASALLAPDALKNYGVFHDALCIFLRFSLKRWGLSQMMEFHTARSETHDFSAIFFHFGAIHKIVLYELKFKLKR
jgi:hypothetical protein